jgi:predicted nicotinamide N-methyase
MGFLNLQNDRYTNSHFSHVYLREDAPYYIGDFIQLLHNESQQWNKLYQLVRTDEKQTDKQNPEENHRTFIKGMHNLGMSGEAHALAHAVDLSDCRLMVDAGGGSGLYSAILCQKYPGLKSIILDKSETLSITREMISDLNESGRIRVQEADITKDIFGEGIDVVLLSDVIYDESVSELILRNAWNCLNQNGILIVRGYYSDRTNTGSLFGTLFVLNQLVFDPGRKIVTLTSLQKKISEIGFKITRISPLTELSFIILANRNL